MSWTTAWELEKKLLAESRKWLLASLAEEAEEACFPAPVADEGTEQEGWCWLTAATVRQGPIHTYFFNDFLFIA